MTIRPTGSAPGSGCTALRHTSGTRAGRALHDAFTSLMNLSRDGSTAVVTHALVIAWVAAHVVGGPADAWLRMPVDNTSVTTVEHGSHGNLLLRRFDSLHH
jgi:broad specificity phosphatase PhoE